MMDRDPLDMWLLRTSVGRSPEPQEQTRMRESFDRLDAWLSQPPTEKRREIPRIHGGWFSNARVEPPDREHVQDLYRRLVITNGTNKSYAEEELLTILALGLDPDAIPFFVELLDLAPPRDKRTGRRRELALAALALLAYRHDDAAALKALVEAGSHPNAQVRALAVHYLGIIFLGPNAMVEPQITNEPDSDGLRRPIPPEISTRIGAIASNDKSFEPRFIARAFLRDAGQPVPLDYPGGTFTFRVRFKDNKQLMSRTIALRSEQTLDDLHLAIQHALKWDNDHLYSFFLNGKLYDERYGFACPMEDDNPPWTNEAVIGELGLTLKHAFLYYFDYGDSHEFEVDVVAIDPKAERGRYPRLVESKGRAPAQYGYDEDDEDDEDV